MGDSKAFGPNFHHMPPALSIRCQLSSSLISIFEGDHGEKVENNDGTTGAPAPAEINMTAEELENFSQSADEALKIYDTDNDGYISFREFFVVMNKEQDEAEKNKNQQQT